MRSSLHLLDSMKLVFNRLLSSINFPRSKCKRHDPKTDKGDQVMEPIAWFLRSVLGWFAHQLKPDLSSNF